MVPNHHSNQTHASFIRQLSAICGRACCVTHGSASIGRDKAVFCMLTQIHFELTRAGLLHDGGLVDKASTELCL